METFVSNPDTKRFETLVEGLSNSIDYFNTVYETIVKEYSVDLDSIMTEIYAEIKKDDVSNEFLEMALLKLNYTLYDLEGKLERLGIYDDVSKASMKEVYNKSYLGGTSTLIESAKSKPTVAEKQAIAEENSQYELILNNIYSRAYKTIKGKKESGYDMVNSIRKIQTIRNNETTFARTSNVLAE